jgi:two-component system KDP operon response regulator KdpE
MNNNTILLIDDDQTLLELLEEHFKSSGWKILTAQSGSIGLETAFKNDPDMVILDVMMPGMDGWQVCQKLRESSSVPIIMLTAKDQEIDKLRGFRLGIDDYVTKPFSFAELSARVGAVMTRVKSQSTPLKLVERDDLSIDIEQRRVQRDKKLVELTPTEYRLLEILVRYAGRTVPTEQLLQEVWGTEYAGEPEHVKHYIWTLRKKLELDPGNPKHILTERGFGYRFE